MDSSRINFYEETGTYGCFSNFYMTPFNYAGVDWKTSEHAFQGMKFEGTVHMNSVANLSYPGEAAQVGRDRSLPLRSDWEEVKDRIMEEVLYAKFKQNLEIRRVLLSTAGKMIVEHTVNDAYWGDAGDGSGKNMLGKTLMKVREALADET